MHALLPCILPAPCQKGICVAVQPARSGNQGISFPGSINASAGTREVIRTSSQGRKGPSPSAKTHTYVRLKWSQPQLPARSPPVSASVGITQQRGRSSCLALQKGVHLSTELFSQLVSSLTSFSSLQKAKKQSNQGIWMPSVTVFLWPGRERRPRGRAEHSSPGLLNGRVLTFSSGKVNKPGSTKIE